MKKTNHYNKGGESGSSGRRGNPGSSAEALKGGFPGTNGQVKFVLEGSMD